MSDKLDYSKMLNFAIYDVGIKVELDYRDRDNFVRDCRRILSYDGRKFNWVDMESLGLNPDAEDCVWLEDQLESLWLKHKGKKSLPKIIQ